MTMDIMRLRVFEVKYIGPSSTRGSRIKITDLWRGESVTLSYDHSFNRMSEQAMFYLIGKGFNIVADSADQIAKTDFILSDTFNISIKGGN